MGQQNNRELDKYFAGGQGRESSEIYEVGWCLFIFYLVSFGFACGVIAAMFWDV